MDRGGRLAGVRTHSIANDIGLSGASTRFTTAVEGAHAMV
jgi:hypothetical protein